MYIKQIVYIFFFNDTATTEIYTLSLHDALPILIRQLLLVLLDNAIKYTPEGGRVDLSIVAVHESGYRVEVSDNGSRSEEHTSELQSRQYLVCRLLLEKKKYILPPILYIQITCCP